MDEEEEPDPESEDTSKGISSTGLFERVVRSASAADNDDVEVVVLEGVVVEGAVVTSSWVVTTPEVDAVSFS